MTPPEEPRTARERVYQALKQGPATRPELASRTGLSVVSVIAATDELVGCGLVVLEDTPTPLGRGRPAQRARLRLEETTITALDLGGPQVTTARHNLLGQRAGPPAEHGPPIQQFSGDPETNVQLLCGWLQGQGKAEVSVVSVLGAVHPRTRLLNSYPLGLRGYPLAEELSRRLGWPVLVENDANLSALHSWQVLGLTPEDPLVFLNFSAGIGLGMVLGGHIYCGTTGAAGEVSFGATPGKKGRHEMLVRKLLRHLHSVLPGATTSQVAALAAQGDVGAKQALKRFNQDLARHLTTVATVLDPAVMVLQDLPHATTPLLDEVQKALSELDLPTRVIPSPLGPFGGVDSAGAYGARWLEQRKLSGG